MTDQEHPAGSEAKASSTDLVILITQLYEELHPGTPAPPITHDSQLDRDIGFDSLSRVELMSRIERRFEISLPEAAFADAQSVADLLNIITNTGDGQGNLSTQRTSATLTQAEASVPYQAQTLLEVLQYHAHSTPGRVQIRLLDEQLNESPITYRDLRQYAGEFAYGLTELGIERGSCVAIMLPTSADYFFSFFGILLAGAVPVPIYPPARISQLEDHLRRHCAILNNCGAQALVTVEAAIPLSQLLKANTPSLRHITTVAQLRATHRVAPLAPAVPTDLAFLQYTSGSTGNPKGVMLTHANLLANVKAMGTAVQATPADVFVSWLPLYHDMGLIGAWLGSLLHAMPLVIMPPQLFLARPHRWLWAIHKYRGTLSAAPNFAYEQCLRRIAAQDIAGLDLSSWRIAFNGAEPVNPETIAKFTDRFAGYGFKPTTMAPVYGLAEAAVGLSIPPLGRIPVIDRIDRTVFSKTGQAIAVKGDDPHPLQFPACGYPLPGHEIRIVDSNGRELPERQQGNIQFRGPSATCGYYHNPDATNDLVKDDWLQPGDLGYIASGDVYITGRSKDLIIRAGRNIYPQELEQAISRLPGIRQERVAVFGSIDPDAGTERLVVVAESRTADELAREQLRTRINELATELVGNPPDAIVLAPPGTILRTSSGKIRRQACRDLYERNAIGPKTNPVWLQLLRLALAAGLPLAQRFLRQAISTLRATAAWLMLVPLAAMAFYYAYAGADIKQRWQQIGRLARLLAKIAGIRCVVTGLDRLPAAGTSAIFVCNHCSYIDSFVVLAFLPPIGQFVAKSELQQNRPLHYFLQRLGTHFVERYDAKRGVADLDKLIALLRTGDSLIIFPEGTFTRRPGLRPFHMGAFVAAAQAKVPVVPVALSGTRSVLRDGTWLPRTGTVSIAFGTPCLPESRNESGESDTWRNAVSLRSTARAFILEHCHEPDLNFTN